MEVTTLSMSSSNLSMCILSFHSQKRQATQKQLPLALKLVWYLWLQPANFFAVPSLTKVTLYDFPQTLPPKITKCFHLHDLTALATTALHFTLLRGLPKPIILRRRHGMTTRRSRTEEPTTGPTTVPTTVPTTITTTSLPGMRRRRH